MAFAQEECYLGIGGYNADEIREIFQLNEEQVENMVNWGAELKFRNDIFENRAKNLLKNHAQSSTEDVLKMSYLYKALMDSIKGNMRMIDKRMLDSFNSKQYNLYMDLCQQMQLTPIYSAKPQVKEKENMNN